ncbi:MAG: sodium:alanine symporter family protein [Candidatus Marinimicrobia bacterium]|nr:sodium:alanine symporter family protein [Candidatus Neomarinimicrobiota bacterium]MCF7839920.1 sodium:alanine symporter family protein [Candidatus Neomarinimicrobiota bacterium]
MAGLIEILTQIKDVLVTYVWEWPTNWFPHSIPFLVLLLLGTGIYVTFKNRFIQISQFRHGVNTIRGIYDNPDDDGDINHFQALSSALSATIGIGNIAGVATAIHYGGPGALFWMWITAIFGMALKFSEATLALKYRKINPDGSASGGPMYYILLGLGQQWKWLAAGFAFFAMISSFGQGNMIQSFTVSDQLQSEFAIPRWTTSLVMSVLVALVILGGIKRIGRVTSRLTPFMAVTYVLGAFLILVLNVGDVLPTFGIIIREAFQPNSAVTGVAGGGFLVFLNTMLWGVKRGLFSNEAGQGSAPIAHAAAKTQEPVREGVVAMLGPFVDTLVVCTMTGLAITLTEAYLVRDAAGELLNGSPMTAYAFAEGLAFLGGWGSYIVTFGVVLFAVSTAISWSYYGDRSAQFLWGDKAIKPYKWIYVFMIFLGGIFSLEIVWGFGDIALGLMAIPNLLAIILLAGNVKELKDEYFSREHLPFKK